MCVHVVSEDKAISKPLFKNKNKAKSLSGLLEKPILRDLTYSEKI